MNPMHVHLALNHFPVIAVIIGFVLLEAGVWRKSGALQKASLALLAAAAVSAVPVFLSGDAAEPLAEATGALESLIEAHEEAAELALWLVGVTGALAAWALWRARREETPSRRLTAAAALSALLCAGALARAAWLGGLIRHPEIQPDWKAYRGAGTLPGPEEGAR